MEEMPRRWESPDWRQRRRETQITTGYNREHVTHLLPIVGQWYVHLDSDFQQLHDELKHFTIASNSPPSFTNGWLLPCKVLSVLPKDTEDWDGAGFEPPTFRGWTTCSAS